jgi:hypothetical protein
MGTGNDLVANSFEKTHGLRFAAVSKVLGRPQKT